VQGGYDRDTVRDIIRNRKLTADQRETAAALMDQYMSALGDFAGTPLGVAGADRVRGGGEALCGVMVTAPRPFGR
jgi:hypothetical protein